MSSQLPTPPDQPHPLDEAGEGTYDSWQGPEGDPGEEGAPQLQRYLSAIRRRKWVILGITLLGTIGGIAASRFVKPMYETQSTLWIEVSTRESLAQGPVRTGELLQSSSAWIELLKSYVVLNHVVLQEHLYIETDGASRGAFGSFALLGQFRPGSYTLKVAPDGKSFTLSSDGTVVQQGSVGEPVGDAMGFDWTPKERILWPGRVIEFTVVNPRDVAVELGDDLKAALAQEGSFLQLILAGRDPERITSTVNAVAARYVEVAADIKRAKLDQLTTVLDEQRRYAEDNLRDAEIQLEQFRVQTVTLPSDRGAPVAAGLEITQDPVMSRFFEMKVELEQLRNDREAIERILAEATTSKLSLDALTMVPAVQSAPALKSALEERIGLRAEMRALLQRYTSDHPSVEKIQENIADLENRAVPRLAGELRMQLLNREAELESRIGSASSELRQIPPRAIEEARLERRVAIAENLHSMLRQRYEEARLAAVSTIPDIRILDPAVAPSRPTRDPRVMVIAVGFLGSLGLSLAGVILLDRFDPRVRYPEEITHGMGLPILGLVPTVKQLNGKNGDQATLHAAEAFREIRMNLEHAHGAAGPVMLTITSPGSGDGKSFLASNLALAFADQGYRTLIIDGDIRRGTLHRTLGINRVPGLTDYLTGSVTLGDVLQPTKYPNVFLIGAGTRMTNGPELLNSKQMSALLIDLKQRFGAILVDSPPLGAGIDAFALGTLTRNLLLVLRTGTTDRAMAMAKLGMLDRLPIRLLGAILNGAPSGSGAYRYYSYISGYEVMDEEDEVKQLQVGGGVTG